MRRRHFCAAAALAAAATLLGACTPEYCASKAEDLRHCKKQEITDAQLSLCKADLPGSSCSDTDLRSMAKFHECKASECLEGVSEDDALNDCLHWALHAIAGCGAP